MLSIEPSIALCVLSRSLSFNRSSLIIFIIISSEDSLIFSLMVVVVVFNLSPLCIEKYFLSWHFLFWCLQNLNPFLLVNVPGYVLESNSVTAVFLCCVIYAFRKALSRESERKPLLFPFPIIVWMWWLWKLLLLEVKISSFEKMYLRLCGFLTAIICFLISCEKMQPQQILVFRYQITSSGHSKEPSASSTTSCLQLDYHFLPRKGLLWGPKRQMTERE